MSAMHKTLYGLRNTRELRAEMLDLAARLAAGQSVGRLILPGPIVGEQTIRDEWTRLLPAIAPEVRARMRLVIEHAPDEAAERPQVHAIDSDVVLLDRPNYRSEVLRLLLEAYLTHEGSQSIKSLIERIGASQTPIRAALAELKQVDVVRGQRGGVEIAAGALSTELLTRIQALPQTLRFRFARGARVKPPAKLLERALPLLGAGPRRGWEALSLSGTPVAQTDAPAFGLMGVPRLDLMAHVPRKSRTFDAGLLRLLDDGLEPEPNVLAPAPVVITLVRAETVPRYLADAGLQQVRCAHRADVFLSLLDLGLREQALQYARAMRT